MSTNEEEKYSAERWVVLSSLPFYEEKKAPTLLSDTAHSNKSTIYGKEKYMHFHFTIVPFYSWGGEQRS